MSNTNNYYFMWAIKLQYCKLFVIDNYYHKQAVKLL